MSDISENKNENLQEVSEEVTQEAEVIPEENSEVFSEEVTEFLEEETKAEAKEETKKKKHWIKNKIVREIVSWTGTILLAVLNLADKSLYTASTPIPYFL